MKVTVTYEVEDLHVALDQDGGKCWEIGLRGELIRAQEHSEAGLQFVTYELGTETTWQGRNG